MLDRTLDMLLGVAFRFFTGEACMVRTLSAVAAPPAKSVSLIEVDSYAFGLLELSALEETFRLDFPCYDAITGPKEPS